MRLKLTQPGYENLTGVFGAINFTNGLSDYGVSPQQAEGIMLVVEAELVDEPAPTGTGTGA